MPETYNTSLKDNNGNIIAPPTHAKVVNMADGRTVEVAINEKLVADSGDAKDTIVSFTEVTTKENLVSGDKTSVLWGKQSKINSDVSTSLGQKADKPITIGINGGIRLIGEVQNYSTNNGFNLEAMLHNMHLYNGSQLSNAFITVGKYGNSWYIEGKMHILTDYAGTSNYLLKIQITDSGKIYAISLNYMGSCKWNIINKSDNIVIYDNPQVVSTIYGNVIWDSELNKTKISTSQDLELKADKQWTSDNLAEKVDVENLNSFKNNINLLNIGWYKILYGTMPSSGICKVDMMYNDNPGCSILFAYTTTYGKAQITILSATSFNSAFPIDKIRMVKGEGAYSYFLELHYNVTGSNQITACSWVNSWTKVHVISGNLEFDNESRTSYAEVDVKEIVNGNVATTNKVNISSCLRNGWTTIGGIKLTVVGKMAHITGNIKAGIKAINTVILDLTGLVLFENIDYNPTITAYGQNPSLGLLRIYGNNSTIAVDNNWAIAPSGVDNVYTLDLHISIK